MLNHKYIYLLIGTIFITCSCNKNKYENEMFYQEIVSVSRLYQISQSKSDYKQYVFQNLSEENSKKLQDMIDLKIIELNTTPSANSHIFTTKSKNNILAKYYIDGYIENNSQ